MKNHCHQVINIRNLTPSAFILQLERGDLDFQPGQFLNLGLPEETHRREYSIYSSPEHPYLEVLIKEIPEGHVSPRLRQLSPGNTVAVEGPHGQFSLDESQLGKRPFYLIATGTGISPLHCFVHSYPDMNYQLLHGVRTPEDCYDHHSYPEDRYTACISRAQGTEFQGRVTAYLQNHPPLKQGLFYLCGNADMIYEVFEWLRQQGISRDQVFTEVYF